VLIGGKAFTTYYFGPNPPKPYMSPLRSAQGTVVTRGFPMRMDIPGERRTTRTIVRCFFAHGDINGIDFWGEGNPRKRPRPPTGCITRVRNCPKGEPSSTSSMKSKPRQERTLQAEFELVGPTGKQLALKPRNILSAATLPPHYRLHLYAHCG